LEILASTLISILAKDYSRLIKPVTWATLIHSLMSSL